MMLRLLCVFPETLTMASPPALKKQCCPWQTFASVSEKQLLEGFLHSSFKGHPIVPYLPRYWRIYSHGIGDIWLEIIDNKTVTSEHVLSEVLRPHMLHLLHAVSL